MARLRVGVLFGGCSEEHPVSVKSAQEVARHLDLEKYDPFYIGITRSGAWRLCAAPTAEWEDGRTRPVVLSPDRSMRGVLILEQGRCEPVGLDVLFPVLHGRLGEDGAIQGLAELAGIPYVGCDVQSSALCMDKSLTYLVARAARIATPAFWTLAQDEEFDLDTPTYPVFVKPARSGSSFGVSKVGAARELPKAIQAARQFDSKVLIEEAVDGREVGCALLGDGSDLIAGELDSISLAHGFFRIHQESEPESGSDNSEVVVPADIPAASRALVHETAKAVFRALGCSGLARVDLFLGPRGDVVLNEVNTLPGMTSYSRYPRMMEAAGFSRGEVLDRLLTTALADSRS
jgi:D-alanine---(R)-lactate ligase